MNNKPGALEDPVLCAEVNEKIQDYESKLQNIDSKIVLHSLAYLLAQDISFTRDNLDTYLTTLKDHLSFGNANIYMELVDALPARAIQKNVRLYLPFIREMAEYYSNFSKRMKNQEILRCLEKFADIRFTKPALYNSLLTDLGRNFNNYRIEDFARIFSAFAKLGLKQTDLFDKITLRLKRSYENSAPFMARIISDLFKVNYDSNLYREHVSELTMKLKFSTFQSLVWIRTVISLELENESEILEKLFGEIDLEKGFQARNN